MSVGARRLSWLAGGATVVFSVAIWLLARTQDELNPPDLVSRPMASAVLFATPGLLAWIGAATRRRSVVVAAGVLCMFQSVIAFSGVTLIYLVPGVILLRAGAAEAGDPRVVARDAGRALVVVAVVIGAWAATFAFTETTCWSARNAAGGGLVWERIPLTDELRAGQDVVASTCGSGVMTPTGLWIAAALLIAGFGVASSAPPRRRRGSAPSQPSAIGSA